ncbi:hypothetical protein J1N35_036675 [Gossypium stocksii]|uniref:Uncharacterized protein n=1 Tax=Gossypium stocksii TaxID=47602 RepID=A0A9D3UIC5_9ROSI|nr:hypothetical protein J1N35_036675 [Gossypium stocksii]
MDVSNSKGSSYRLKAARDQLGYLYDVEERKCDTYIRYIVQKKKPIKTKTKEEKNESIKKKQNFKFNMHDPKAAPKILAKLPRVSNYIKRNKNGRERLRTIENDAPDPIRMKFNEEAKVLKILDGKGASTFISISEVKE